MALFILLSPLLFYSYQGFPQGKMWESFFGTYDSKFYQSVQTMMWVLLGKLVPFSLLIVWFFTCKHWWYHVILVPIGMYSIQIYISVLEDVSALDYNQIHFLIPVVAIIAAFCYSIRIQIFDRIYGIELDQELKRVKWNGKIVKVPADSPLDLEEVEDDEIDDLDDDDDDNEPMWMA